MENISQKRILLLYKLLYEQTDEKNLITTDDILNYWQENGIETDRRSVRLDIDLLVAFGYDIQLVKSGKYNKYYLKSRKFDLPELKLLVDAVESSHIIPEKETKILVHKITELSEKKDSKELKRPLLVGNKYKADNTQTFENIDVIYKAINRKKKISFRYLDYAPDKTQIHKHNSYEYVLSPYSTAWDENNYYVIGFSEKHGHIGQFRVDRIADIRLLRESAVPKENYDPGHYTSNVFGMFSGDPVEVTLRCTNDTMKSVIDKFGKNVRTKITDPKHYEVTAYVQPSPPFYGWIFQFGGDIQITSPEYVKEEMKERAKKIYYQFD